MKCPVCGKEYNDPPALSRKDNRTEICPDCGTIEALSAAGLSGTEKDRVISLIKEATTNLGGNHNV